MGQLDGAKRQGALSTAISLWGEKKAAEVAGQSWTEIYAMLRDAGFAWSPRQRVWYKSQRAVKVSKRSNVEMFFARIVFTCDVEDVDYHVAEFKSLIELDDYTAVSVHTMNVEGSEGQVTVTIRIKRPAR
jgi:hypothetical protein